MYTPATSCEDLLEKSPHAETLQALDQLVTQTTTMKRHYYDNGQTFSAIAFGELGDLGRKKYAYAKAGIINLNSQKNYVGLYIWAGGDGKGIIQKHSDVLPKSAFAKGCLHIRNQQFLTKYETVIKQIILEATN